MTQIWTFAIKANSTLSRSEVLAKVFCWVDMQITELQHQVTKARQNLSVNSLPCGFFIIPIAPLETVPTFVSQASDLAKNSATLARSYLQVIGEMSHSYNWGMSCFVSEMQITTDPLTSPGWVKTYDFEHFWRDFIAHQSQVIDYLLKTDSLPQTCQQSYQPTVFNTPCLQEVNGKQVICSDLEQYVYWTMNPMTCSQDSLHPTTTMHQIIAQSLLPAVNY
ncbi:uncharacterized protein MELLADRAFT_59331 [Melampsora larici-populina 98AG31]|uniref:Uncharacterized protein n=1 Tax=Melampsora larici-populina (strain 98AG31 / pathotype 3-4-7) TaxID=747676 RepID=F4R5X6_MELLP|nr:uncharacterized protein MELLADRAFT_59331 [Melampsora larici-populina 98AG31]EGG12114.1 hypothetical protein MELLADRAFT_59331 [Melampsora larici-populina 98AG31]